MKKSKKITVGIIIFFVVIALIIIGRYGIGLYFEKKFSKRPPPGVIVSIVKNKSFSETLESYCTSLSNKTVSYKIKKNELLEKIELNRNVKKGDVIAKLTSKIIYAPFSGVVGKRGISGSSLGSENTIILTLDDSSTIYCDLKIPEIYAGILEKDLKLNAKFSAYKGKNYEGKLESFAGRIEKAGLDVMFHTFSALPGACAAAEKVLAIMTEENLTQAENYFSIAE